MLKILTNLTFLCIWKMW